MAQKLRRLWGRVEIRVLVLLVFGVVLSGLALAAAQTLKDSSSESVFPTVSAWGDLVKCYLDFRERNHALVVPGWYMSYGQTEANLKKYGFEKLQREPDWYWTFNDGVYVFENSSEISKHIKSGTQIVLYEDMAKQELLVLSAPEKEGGEWREEIVYTAPKSPELKKGEDYERYLNRELLQRRVVWQVTLKSKSQVEKEAAELEAAQKEAQQKDFGEGGGMRMMMGMEEVSNHLWLSIRGPESGLTNLEIAAHVPSGFESPIEIFMCTNLLDFWWTLAETNVLTEGSDTVYWTYQMTESETGPLYVTIGNAVIDSDGDGVVDAREKFLYHTSSNTIDTDGDSLPDGWEIQNGLDPLSSQGNDGATGDMDGDGLSNIEEWTVLANPWQFESVTVLGPDDLYEGGGMLLGFGPGKGIQYRSLSALRSKCGLSEYCNSSQPPKYYLAEHGSYHWERTSYINPNYPIKRDYEYTTAYEPISDLSQTFYIEEQTRARWEGGCDTLTYMTNEPPYLPCSCDTNYDWDIVSCEPTRVYKHQYAVEDVGYYLDCSGLQEGAGYRETTCDHTLSDEYTTGMLLANVADDLTRCGALTTLPWGEGRLWNGNCETGSAATAASRGLSTNEDQVTFTKIGYRFKVVGLQTGQIYRLNWLECFTPEGGSTAVVLQTRTGVIRGDGGTQYIESASFVIDPPQTDGVIEPVVFKRESLLPDHIEREVDDGDGDDDTRTFVINMTTNAGDIVTVTATPNPDLPEASLPSCWTLDVIEGTANGSGKLTRTINRTQPSKTVLRCSGCGGDEKITTVYVVHCTYSGFSDGALPGHAWWILRIEPSSAVDGVLQKISPPFTWTVNADGGFFPLHEGQWHDVGWVRIPDGSGGHTATGDHDWMIPFQSLISGLTDISAWVLSPGTYDWDTRNCVYGSLRIGGDCGVNMPSFSYPDFFAPWQFADWLNAQP